MKTVGIAMLFGLCTLIGIRIAARKTARFRTLQQLKERLCLFSERISGGCGSLKDATSGEGVFAEMLERYLKTLSEGGTEAEAARQAADLLLQGSAEQTGANAFFTGLSAASRSDLLKRAERLTQTLERAEREADEDAKKARVIRVSGALIGAGLAILLL